MSQTFSRNSSGLWEVDSPVSGSPSDKLNENFRIAGRTYVSRKATAGTGTLADPWTGWHTFVNSAGPDVLCYFENGVYASPVPLALNYNRCKLVGQYGGRVILRYTGASVVDGVVEMRGELAPSTGGGESSYQILVSDLVLDGGGKAKAAVHNNGSHRCRYERLSGGNTTESFIRLNGPSYVAVYDCYAIDQGQRTDSGSVPLDITWTSIAPNGIIIDDNKFEVPSYAATQIEIRNFQCSTSLRTNGPAPSGSIGIDIRNGITVNVVGGSLEPCDIPIRVSSVSERCTFKNVDCEASTSGIQCSGNYCVFEDCNAQADITIGVGNNPYYTTILRGWYKNIVNNGYSTFTDCPRIDGDIIDNTLSLFSLRTSKNGTLPPITTAGSSLFLNGVGVTGSDGVININDQKQNGRADVWSLLLARKMLRTDGGLNLQPLGAAPSLYGSGDMNIYPKGSKLIFEYNDGGTIRYKFIEMSGTSVTITQTTSAP